MTGIHIVSLFSALSALTNAALAAFVIGKDPSSRVNRSLALLAFSFAIWGLGEFFMRSVADPVHAMFWVRFEALGYVGVGSFYLVFSLRYSDLEQVLDRFWVKACLTIPPVVFLWVIWFTDLVYPGIETHGWGNRPATGWAFYPLVTYIALEWVCGALVFGNRVRTLEHGVHRRATIYLLIGTVLPIVVATLTAGVFPIIGVDMPEMATHVSMLNAAILVYIIQRYRVLTFVPSRFADTLVSSTEDGIMAMDTEGFISYVSPGAEKMFGRTAEDLLGIPFAGLFEHGEDEWATLMVLLNKQDAVKLYQAGMRTGKHDLFTASLTLGFLRMESGQMTGTVAVIRDVTEVVKLQEQIQKADRLDSLGALASGIAHDFNNILSVIIPRSEMLQRKRSDDPVVVEETSRIVRAANTAGEMVRRLLAFARGSVKEAVIMDPNRLIRDTVELLSRTIPKTIQIEQKLQENLPYVEADHLQFEQALMNLILNGKDAMPGGGKITVTSRRLLTERELQKRTFTLPAGDWVIVSVQDNGTGIPIEYQDRIFDPLRPSRPARGRDWGWRS
jgi:PAS domain S-box-containing protein